MTNKKAMVVLIVENEKKDQCYINRIKPLSELYNFDLEIITPSDISDSSGKCKNKKCKCNKD